MVPDFFFCFPDSLCLILCLCLLQLLHSGQIREMALFGFLILTSLCIAGREALSLSECGADARRPGEVIGIEEVTKLFHEI